MYSHDLGLGALSCRAEGHWKPATVGRHPTHTSKASSGGSVADDLTERGVADAHALAARPDTLGPWHDLTRRSG